ncbi:hypothetical protein [Xanthomonas oryzae pv. oryzae MAFF 311018]|nr:hypothetical protein [Xanthomonas oryzae pv. oryzae MAFF 311018]
MPVGYHPSGLRVCSTQARAYSLLRLHSSYVELAVAIKVVAACHTVAVALRARAREHLGPHQALPPVRRRRCLAGSHGHMLADLGQVGHLSVSLIFCGFRPVPATGTCQSLFQLLLARGAAGKGGGGRSDYTA